jgi:hypothetical protein
VRAVRPGRRFGSPAEVERRRAPAH